MRRNFVHNSAIPTTKLEDQTLATKIGSDESNFRIKIPFDPGRSYFVTSTEFAGGKPLLVVGLLLHRTI
jgi:hypothetical protein